MKTAGDLLSQARKGKKISLAKVARHLRLKESILEAIEAGDWPKLPELPFVKGFIKSYAQYLKLDPDYILALLRREYDEAKYPKRTSPLIGPRRLMFTPEKVAKAAFILIILAFVSGAFILNPKIVLLLSLTSSTGRTTAPMPADCLG